MPVGRNANWAARINCFREEAGGGSIGSVAMQSGLRVGKVQDNAWEGIECQLQVKTPTQN
jgi:hypothetical protein